ncbi:pickpocket protein 19-like [Condylostylus longicornis]|uniref:pickpocket protein 19-like n=1 Tax=Condylostylus longicornis TaxID=2530218 RepID=UPI00244DB160|nr:pickpocket protein 19-like [Condylostylus longicornis]
MVLYVVYPEDYIRGKHTMTFNPGLQVFLKNHPDHAPKRISTPNTNPEPKRKSIKEAMIEYWIIYCSKTHVHGVKYLVDPKLHMFEKLIMAVILIAYVFGTVYVCVLFSYQFQESALKIEVESTTYPVYYIVFPALTICNYNRLNWAKINQAQRRFLPSNATQQTIDLFQQFIAQFETFSFGKFSTFGKFQNVSLKQLDGINLTEVMEFLSYRCEELFQSCWWKDQYVSCCDIFALQKSESGFCLSFNSMTNANSTTKKRTDIFYPWHVAKAGFSSALKVFLVLDKSRRSPFNKDPQNGLSVIIHNSHDWPLNEQFIPENTNVSISLDGKLSYANVDTYSMHPDSRECLFDHEYKNQRTYSTLVGLKYSKSNCIAYCHQQHAYGMCNCSLELFYPVDILTQDREPDEELYINYTGDGMKCKCLSECYSVDFDPKILPISLPVNSNPRGNLSYVSIDLFYEKATIMKYRIDVAFGIMDLLVAYGGIAGLFLGFSLFSCIELMYYLTVGFVLHFYENGFCVGCFEDENKSTLLKSENGNIVEERSNIKRVEVRPKTPEPITRE